MLKLLEGDSEIAIDVKHQEPITVKVNMNIVIASNDDLFGVEVKEEVRPVNMIGRPMIIEQKRSNGKKINKV